MARKECCLCADRNAPKNTPHRYAGSASPFYDAMPSAAMAVHTFDDFQQFNTQLNLIATDGCFSKRGTLTKGPSPAAEDLGGAVS